MTTLNNREKQSATVTLLKTDGVSGQTTTDTTSATPAFSSATNVATVVPAAGGAGNRAFEIVGQAPGSATITFTGPGGSTHPIVATVTAAPDTFELQVTLGPVVPK